MDTHAGAERERALLREIGVLHDKLRAMRASGAMARATEIKAIETQSRAKWEELRTVRARPVNGDLPEPTARGHYR